MKLWYKDKATINWVNAPDVEQAKGWVSKNRGIREPYFLTEKDISQYYVQGGWDILSEGSGYRTFKRSCPKFEMTTFWLLFILLSPLFGFLYAFFTVGRKKTMKHVWNMDAQPDKIREETETEGHLGFGTGIMLIVGLLISLWGWGVFVVPFFVGLLNGF